MIRPLTLADLDGCLALSRASNWNQDAADWTRVLTLANAFGIESEGKLAASGAIVCYGQDLAWIGMVLTLPEQRGKGYASQLFRTLMDFGLGTGVRCIKLDATELGGPVYRKFGFEDECAVERWRKTGEYAEPRAADTDSIDLALDRQAFGADRCGLLDAFPARRADVDAFACLRPGREHFQFGPCVSRTEEAADRLARWGSSQGPVFWDLFPGNYRATAIAHRLGYAPARKLVRMSYQGRDLDQDPQLVYALSSFEWG